MHYFWRAFLLVKNQWGRRILAALGMIIDSAGLIVIPLIVRTIFDSITEGYSNDYIVQTINQGILGIVAIAFLRYIAVYIEIYYQEGIGNHISHDIRHLLFNRILRLPFSFFDRKKTGDLMSILTRDVDAVRDGTGFVIMLIIVNVLIVIGITVAMFMLQPLLTIIILLTMPLLGILAVWYSRRISPLYQKLQRQSGKLHIAAQENISGIRVVKAFTRSHTELERFGAENGLFYKLSLRIAYLASLVHPTLDSLGMFITLVTLTASGVFVIRGEITLGTMIAFLNFADYIIWPVRQVGWLSEMLSRATAGAKRIFSIIDQENELVEQPDSLTKDIDGKITFDNVSFAYPNGEDALKNFTLTIEKGQTVCLLGLTGSGKTTVANLLTRFYDPTKGKVLIDGIDIRSWNLEVLRSQIGFVFQDNFLFSTSLQDNITMGKSIDADQIKQAIMAAQAQPFINKLPQGLDTIVGERGIGLSGGERQRVAIARAILQSPPILVFDDSSASLDMKTEAQLQKALNELYTGRTVLVIAQRISTAQSADHIVVLDGGAIVEQGTHKQLLAQNGIYTQLNSIQSANMSLNPGGEQL